LAAAEGRRACGLEAIKLEDSTITRDPAQIEAEVTRYFEALFQGRHAVGTGNSGPSDSGTPFQPRFDRLGDFLVCLPRLSVNESALLDLPVNVPDLEEAVKAACVGRSPGLDGLSYEFYKAVFGWVGPAMADSLNTMLEAGQLAPSLCKGVIRLLPKVKGVPLASQLRPITLPNTDYKLLTKVYVARLMQVLPTILHKSQLCRSMAKTSCRGPSPCGQRLSSSGSRSGTDS
jgi:hypothetical protein